ncbi:MAG: 3-phosphoshikimate 1-carboxyvinyltransferase [Clostridia bacterium]
MITITPPTSKSIAHRAIICGCLSNGHCTISNVTFSDDILATINSLRAIGADIKISNTDVIINKSSFHFGTLDCNESGSTLRFLLPIVATIGTGGEFIGKKSLMSRPIDTFLSLLTKSGVTIQKTDDKITIKNSLQSFKYYVCGDISSQYLTGLMLALPLLNKECEINVTTTLFSKSYIDLTIMVLKSFGISVQNENYKKFIIPKDSRYQSTNFTIETDYSAAAFFLVASKIDKKLNILGLNPHSKQGDKAIVDILNHNAPFCIDVSDIPDLVPIIAVYMCHLVGKSKITNAGRLRFKESDRLDTTVSELRSLGGNITLSNDSIIINGTGRLKGGVYNSHNDHRIAMAMAIASLICDTKVTCIGKDCVNKSYPNFWEDFNKLGKEIL